MQDKVPDQVQDTASLLLVTHVPVRAGPHGPQIDDQTAAGIAQWCRHFDAVTFYGTVAVATAPPARWVDTYTGILGARARIAALPHAYAPPAMLRALGPARAVLRREIAAHRHLCFTLGSIFGDWPSVAAWEAIRAQRRFAAWIDRVEPDVLRGRAAGRPLQRLGVELMLPLTQAAIHALLRRSAVALLQGGDTFEHYRRFASDPHCTYDTHTHADERITPAALAAKQARVLAGAPLEIVYVGRAAAMKGPYDWLATLAELHRRGVPFRATWIGDGPDLAAIRARAAALGLGDRVDLPGFEGRREVLLRRMREADLLLFCHKTPESARCLIEALVCGCPIVGYASAYPRELTAARGGSVLVPQNDVAALAARVAALAEDRPALARLIAQAADSGTLYTEDAAYAQRAALMKLA